MALADLTATVIAILPWSTPTQPQDRNCDRGHYQGYQGNQSRQGGISRRQDRDNSRSGRKNQLLGRQAGGKRRQPDHRGH